MKTERLTIRRRDLILNLAFAAISLSVVSEATGKAPTVSDYSDIDFKPVIIDNGFNKDPVPIRKDEPIVVFPSPVSSGVQIENQEVATQIPQQIEEKPSNFEIARQKIISYPEIFSQKWAEDFDIYGKIYMGVSEKYPEVDWFLLWIVHEAETGASDSVIAFNGGTKPYYGGMQRNPAYWPESYVKEAASGLEYLADLPQRHADDWREIATAGKELRNNINQYENLGEEKAVSNALSLYSAKGPALERFKKWLVFKGIFNS